MSIVGAEATPAPVAAGVGVAGLFTIAAMLPAMCPISSAPLSKSKAPPKGTTTRLTLPAGILALGGGLELAHGQPVTMDFPPP